MCHPCVFVDNGAAPCWRGDDGPAQSTISRPALCGARSLIPGQAIAAERVSGCRGGIHTRRTRPRIVSLSCTRITTCYPDRVRQALNSYQHYHVFNGQRPGLHELSFRTVSTIVDIPIKIKTQDLASLKLSKIARVLLKELCIQWWPRPAGE